MLGAGLVGLFVPLPGASLLLIGSLALIGEIQRVLHRRVGLPNAIAAEVAAVKTPRPG